MLSWTLKGLSILSVLIINQLLVWVMDKLTIFVRRPAARPAEPHAPAQQVTP